MTELVPPSPFLALPASAYVAQNALSFAVRDRYPVSPGHTLVVPFRAVATWFDASSEEQLALLALVDEVKRALDTGVELPDGVLRKPDGYNVGFNAGEAAGQTVMHLHVHVIPRFLGDVEDPRGGIRHVIPGKGNYLSEQKHAALTTGGVDDPFARRVIPLFDQAEHIAIVAAFVQESGLRRIKSALLSAVSRGAHVRLLTGNYLDITQSSALEQLLDWESATVAASGDHALDTQTSGSLVTRVIETEKLPVRIRSFHPKSWRFEHSLWGLAYVGSSNLSLSALDSGIEWNLGIDRSREPETFARLRSEFDKLWETARPLDAAWIAEYALRARLQPAIAPLGETEVEVFEPLPEPHATQVLALGALRAARKEGRRRALVVLATGLGKTLLATLDYKQLREELGTRPRLLFVAHRREILTQAAQHFRRYARECDPTLSISWCAADDSDLSADIVFASVAKLARSGMLARLRTQRFDYVVIDEVHHAAADSYRRILDVLQTQFLLGLTATPDRADDGDVAGLFDDFIAFRAGIAEGIAIARLVPFAYHGVKDDIDYANIPWRNQRFEPVALTTAAQTEARMKTLFRAWSAHPGTRTLVFCCSVEHAKFVKEWLIAQGVRVAAVFAGAGSDDREATLRRLAAGELDAVCAVDVFNEGVDVPSLDRVVMLRPTESRVVFMQQLGRGLRASQGKTSLTVIDFVGNHRVFLDRLRALLSISDDGGSLSRLRAYLEGDAPTDLPEGCSVELELEAKALLAELFRVPAADAVERGYRELRLVRGERPTAGDLLRSGHDSQHVAKRHGSWFEFVAAEGDLSDSAAEVALSARPLLRSVEQTFMTRSFKMVLLEALLELDGLTGSGVALPSLASRSWDVLSRSPELLAEVPLDARPDGTARGDTRWRSYWRSNPVEAWTTAKKTRVAEFRLEGERLVVDSDADDVQRPILAALLRELVDYRLARYRRRLDTQAPGEAFLCKVLRNERDPILKLPPRQGNTVPDGECDVRVPDGAVWRFRFAKEFINVARPVGTDRNQLPDLLRGWFGPATGTSGTSYQVRFSPSPDGLWIEPVSAQVLAFPGRRNTVAAYPDLRAAAGHVGAGQEALEREEVALPIDAPSEGLFAVRVAGESMNGGNAPLHNGDWALLRLARGAAPSTMTGRVVLAETEDESSSLQYQLKRLTRRDDHWELVSDNPAGPTFEAGEKMTVIARLERVFAPDSLAPPVGTMLAEVDLARAFGLGDLPATTGRHAGHLFTFVADKSVLVSPSEIALPGIAPRPGETAFVLARRDAHTWRYLGVGRRREDLREALFEIPEVDYETWRMWGDGRSASRTLPDHALSSAQRIVNALLALEKDERVLERGDGRRAFIRESAARGGLRIDGGPGGFGERTVSLTDLAWVVVTAKDVDANGGVLDEARVNRARYLEGTAKGSTRWIDTGWAIAAWQAAVERVGSLD